MGDCLICGKKDLDESNSNKVYRLLEEDIVCDTCFDKHELTEQNIFEKIKTLTGREVCRRCLNSDEIMFYDEFGDPICLDHLEEDLSEFWENYDLGDYESYLIDNSFKKYLAQFDNHECPNCKADNLILKDKEFNSCWNCSWEKEVNNS